MATKRPPKRGRNSPFNSLSKSIRHCFLLGAVSRGPRTPRVLSGVSVQHPLTGPTQGGVRTPRYMPKGLMDSFWELVGCTSSLEISLQQGLQWETKRQKMLGAQEEPEIQREALSFPEMLQLLSGEQSGILFGLAPCS